MACEDCSPPPFFDSNLFAFMNDAVGVTSRIKDKNGKVRGHWLLFDIDSVSDFSMCLRWLAERRLFGDGIKDKFYRTQKGYHLIIYKVFGFDEVRELLMACPYVDQEWVVRGAKRGYWFLETKSKMDFPYRMEYMKIKRNGKQILIEQNERKLLKVKCDGPDLENKAFWRKLEESNYAEGK